MAPEGPQGARLNDVAVYVVGYVPIDHPTSYYQSRSPAWERKVPRQPGQCDGWPGLWPDPLQPRSTFSLAAATTQPIWILVNVGRNAPAGDYRGMVCLIHKHRTVAEVPFTVHVWDFALPEGTRLPLAGRTSTPAPDQERCQGCRGSVFEAVPGVVDLPWQQWRPVVANEGPFRRGAVAEPPGVD